MPQSNGLVAAVIAAWPNFRQSTALQLAAPKSEARLLAYIYIASFLGFVASIPEVAALSIETDNTLIQLLFGRLFSALFFAPLFFYLIAGLGHFLLARIGGKGSYYDARLALFWALLVATPLLLVLALVRAFLPLVASFDLHMLISATGFGGFSWIWANCFAEAEKLNHAVPLWIGILAIPVMLTVAIMTNS